MCLLSAVWWPYTLRGIEEVRETGQKMQFPVFTWFSVTLRLAFFLWAGAAGGFRRCTWAALGVWLLLLFLRGWGLEGRRRVLLSLVQCDLLLAAHTRDGRPAGAGQRGQPSTSDMQTSQSVRATEQVKAIECAGSLAAVWKVLAPQFRIQYFNKLKSALKF